MDLRDSSQSTPPKHWALPIIYGLVFTMWPAIKRNKHNCNFTLTFTNEWVTLNFLNSTCNDMLESIVNWNQNSNF